jgi:hypothetical protein
MESRRVSEQLIEMQPLSKCLQYDSYRVEDKCICRRRVATATWVGKDFLGPWGSPRRLESPCCCSSPTAVRIHWCGTVPPAVGFWTCLLLVSSQVFLLLVPVPARLPAPQHGVQRPSFAHSSLKSERSIFPGPVHQ